MFEKYITDYLPFVVTSSENINPISRSWYTSPEKADPVVSHAILKYLVIWVEYFHKIKMEYLNISKKK